MKQRLPGYIAAEQLRNEKGASMVEYALLASLIAVAAIGSVSALGWRSQVTYNEVSLALGGIQKSGTGGPPIIIP